MNDAPLLFTPLRFAGRISGAIGASTRRRRVDAVLKSDEVRAISMPAALEAVRVNGSQGKDQARK